MKDSKQILKAIEICLSTDSCLNCPYIDDADGVSWCTEKLCKDVLDLVEQLQPREESVQ